MVLYYLIIAFLYKKIKWGLFDRRGQILLPVEHDSLGYVVSTTKDKSMNNLLVIPNYEGIVFGKDKENRQRKYGLVNSLGEVIIPCELDEIYSTTTGNTTEYYMRYLGQLMNVTNYLQEQGAQNFSSEAEENENTNTITNTTGNTQNTVGGANTNVVGNTVTNTNTTNTTNTANNTTGNVSNNTTTTTSGGTVNNNVVEGSNTTNLT